MIKEVPFCVNQAEKQPELKSDVNTSVIEFINLLGILGYQCLNQEKTKKGYNVNLVEKIKQTYRYPRFHIELTIPIQIPQLEITSFHIDRSPHKTHIDYSRKNHEVKRLIEALEKKESSAIRDELLCLFRFELLFGNVREINRLKGETQEARWGRLLKDKKRDKLRRNNKHKWREKEFAPLEEDKIN